jgi:hypothetical protein
MADFVGLPFLFSLPPAYLPFHTRFRPVSHPITDGAKTEHK